MVARPSISYRGVVRNKSVYFALGVNVNGGKEVLGIWIEQTEGAKFRLKVVNELKTRGVEDILIACCDGLKGFPEAIETVFPNAVVQTCIVHVIRNSVRFVSYKDRREVVRDLKPIYTLPPVVTTQRTRSRPSTTNGSTATR